MFPNFVLPFFKSLTEKFFKMFASVSLSLTEKFLQIRASASFVKSRTEKFLKFSHQLPLSIRLLRNVSKLFASALLSNCYVRNSQNLCIGSSTQIAYRRVCSPMFLWQFFLPKLSRLLPPRVHRRCSGNSRRRMAIRRRVPFLFPFHLKLLLTPPSGVFQ